MIFHPRVGQNVRVHYAKHVAAMMPYHGMHALVRVVSGGPGPRNVGVEVDGKLVVIPRGNLVAIEIDVETEIAPAVLTGAMEGAI